MYRPTVRYADCFRDYVDEVVKATGLDRNQIFRLAMYLLPYTKEGRDVLNFFSSSPLPSPKWNLNSMVEWYGEPLDFALEGGTSAGEITSLEGGTSDVKEESLCRSEPKVTRFEGQIHQETKDTNNEGQIIFRLGNSILLPRR
jgi:hypothetical protein